MVPTPASLPDDVPPVFETSRLRLRPWRDTDAPGEGEGPDAASLRFMPAGAQPGPEDFGAWLARRRKDMDAGGDLHWCIADLATDEVTSNAVTSNAPTSNAPTSGSMLGNIQIFRMGPVEGRFQGELGYWLRPGARGRGVIGEAVEPVVALAFRPIADGGLGLTRLHAATDSDNYASQAILVGAGFRRWGADHQAWRRTDGSLSDGAYFELLAFEGPASELTGSELTGSEQNGTGGRVGAAVTALSPARLDGERVRLRPWTDDDLPRLLGGFAGWMSRPVDELVAREWLASRRRRQLDGQLVSWCIAELSSDEAVGNIDVFDIGRPLIPGGAEIGYWTHPDSRGKGLMTEALRRLLPHLMGSTESGGLGLRRVTARTSETNLVSQAVMKAIGMHQWGSAPGGSIGPDGIAVSQVHYAVLAGDLDPATGSQVAGSQVAGSQVLGFEPITLEGKGIRLREWRHTDAERVAEACSDERTQHWLAGSLPSPYTLEDAHSYIVGRREEAHGGHVYWCAADLESDVCLGSLALMDLREALGTVGEIGYWTHPGARGRGVMSEAVRLAVRHAFIPCEDGGLGRKRLRLNAADGNVASQHIALANGFVEVGRDRQAEPLGDGTFADLIRFDLLVGEWESTQPRGRGVATGFRNAHEIPRIGRRIP